VRLVRDLPVLGVPVWIEVQTSCWRCADRDCPRQIFTARLPGLAAPHARRSDRTAAILRIVGHGAGGRPAERLLEHLGIPASRNTVLRHLKGALPRARACAPLRVVGIDDWAWTKGHRYGTIIVDLERRSVADVIPDRSAVSVSRWLRQHPGIELICRDRYGLYAEGARKGAPQVGQVANRFHLLQNLRERFEMHLSWPIQSHVPKPGPEASGGAEAAHSSSSLHEAFTRVRTLQATGRSVADIVRITGLSRKRVDKWVRLDALPERNVAAPTSASPARFHAYMAQRWSEGITKIRWLFSEIKRLGYTGCSSRVAKYIAPWRQSAAQAAPAPAKVLLPVNPATGTRISSLVAAALCMRPRSDLNQHERGTLGLLKKVLPGFCLMRHMALRFQAVLRSRSLEHLEAWIREATQSGIHPLQRFAKSPRRDGEAVRNAVTQPWSSGQVKGQINRLKTLKRAMYGQAGVDLLRARMLPLH
jgi:transposase